MAGPQMFPKDAAEQAKTESFPTSSVSFPVGEVRGISFTLVGFKYVELI